MNDKSVILIGNLKQNPETFLKTVSLAKEYLKLKKINKNIKLGMAVPTPFVMEINKKFGKSISIFAQNVSGENGGAYTGEFSAMQLSSTGVKNVIIGHSERRAKGETNDDIRKQVSESLSKKINIVLCVGEKERHEDTGHIRFVNEQLETALMYVKKPDLKNIVVAYEPVWAIGKDATRSANENEIYEMTIAIRKKLVEMFGNTPGKTVPIIYGGSANSKNCADIMKVHNIEGFLLGRASLDAKEMKKIIEIISK